MTDAAKKQDGTVANIPPSNSMSILRTRRQPHPDTANGVKVANTDRQYFAIRIDCMDGSYAGMYEDKTKNPPKWKEGNAPVGEFCTSLMRNSADVDANPARFKDRPETSLLAPYVAIGAERGYEQSWGNGELLNKTIVRRSELPENKDKTDAFQFGTTTPPFVATPGAVIDANFTKAVRDARSTKTIPPLPTGSMEELYVTTDSCFRNLGTTIGQCAQAGKDQAALYLNGTDMFKVGAPLPTPTTAVQEKAKGKIN